MEGDGDVVREGEGEGDLECEGDGDADFDGLGDFDGEGEDSVRTVGVAEGTYRGATWVGEGLAARDRLACAEVGSRVGAVVATAAAAALLEGALTLGRSATAREE